MILITVAGLTADRTAAGGSGRMVTPGLDLPMMITPEESAAYVLAVIDNYDLEDTGTFISHKGEVIPW